MRNLKSLQVFGVFLTLALMVIPVNAHEYWLEPDKTAIAVGEETAVRLDFGKEFLPGDERPLQIERTVNFQLFGQKHFPIDLLSGASKDQKPIAVCQGNREGAALIAMERSPANIVFGRAKYLAYAKEEGHEISDGELPESIKAVHEEYSRYLKTVVRVGETLNKAAMKTLGQTYEIVPVGNPFGVATGALTFKVLFKGEPLGGAQVTSIHRLGGNLTVVKTRTNAKGKCILPISHDGRWLIRSVKIDALPSTNPTFANYHSYWASLTFGYEN